MGLSAFTWTAYALINFVELSLRTPARSPVTVSSYPRSFDPYVLATELVSQAATLVPVALVVHVFGREGRSAREAGLVVTRLDVAFGFGLGAAGLGIGVALINASRLLGLPTHQLIPVNTDASPPYVVLFFVSAAVAALSEEVIVNAYLVTRLEDLGWGGGRALAASALVRGGYHLYQGLQGLVATGLAGIVLGRIFQRTRRVGTPVVAHFTFDAAGFLGYWLVARRFRWL